MKNMRNGFTIVEVTISAAISTIIIFGVFTILQVSNKQLQIIHAKMSLQESPREALFKMAQEVRQTSKNKIDPSDWSTGAGGVEQANTINFIVPVPAPDATTLVDSNFSPQWASNIQYSLDGTTHQILRTSTDLTTLATKQAVLANEVTALAFSRQSSTPGLITIQVDAQRELSDGTMVPETPIPMTAQAEARNP